MKRPYFNADDGEQEIALNAPSGQRVRLANGQLGVGISVFNAPMTLLELYAVNPYASPRLLALVNQTMQEHPTDTIVIVIHRYKPETIHGRRK
jgi:hypothetical protein